MAVQLILRFLVFGVYCRYSFLQSVGTGERYTRLWGKDFLTRMPWNQ
jgi:hypothetical protein